jgi:DNA-directed RNA polymerase subunit K/omega
MEPVSAPVKIAIRIKTNYLEPAQQRIPSPELLVNVVRQRVRQLVQGHRALTSTDPRMEFSEIALKEIGEGKLAYELAGEGETQTETVSEAFQQHDGVTPARF